MKEIKYSLRICQGIFNDKTYGVYAIPNYNENIEYQIISRLESLEEAQTIAELIIKNVDHRLVFDDKLVSSQAPQIILDRKNELDNMISEMSEEKQEKIIVDKISGSLPKMSAKQFLPFSKITRKTPYILAFFAIIVFYFNFSFNFPSWIPVLSDYMSGSKFDKMIFAKWFPFLILISTLSVQIISMIQNTKFSTLRDNILCLSLKYNWRREKFNKLYAEIIESSSYSWLRKSSEWMKKLDLNSLKSIIIENTGTNSEDVKNSNEAVQFIFDEDFETRIHSLYYMEKEKDFASYKFAINPFFFLINNKRLQTRIEIFFKYGMISFLQFAIDTLPSKNGKKLRQKAFLFSLVYELVLIGGALIWSYILNPWNSVSGYFAMILLFVVSLLPMLLWNYKLLVNNQGLPKALSWKEIQGDTQLIKGL